MLAAMATPETVGVALKLIETYGIEISDEVSELARQHATWSLHISFSRATTSVFVDAPRRAR